MNRSQSMALGAVLVALFAAVMLWPSSTPEVQAPEPVQVPEPVVEVPAAEVAPMLERIHTNAVAAQAEPEPDLRSKHIDAKNRQAYNIAVSDAIVDARVACLNVLVESGELNRTDELVFDAVVVDGEVIDIKIRALVDVQKDTLDCLHNAAWDAGWPKIDVAGEMRFQRVFKAQ